jgi:hypothetical protein
MLKFVESKSTMKTINKVTENKHRKFAPGIKFLRGKFLNFNKGKYLLILLFPLHFLQLNAKVDETRHLWQFTISSGMHSFYAPVENLKWDNPGLAVSAGINWLLGQKQFFSLGLQVQFAKNDFQGNATSLQLLGQFTPVVFKRAELGIGTGAGYRFSGYPSASVKWDGNVWKEGKMVKGIIQIPLQLSLGYRSIDITSVSITPFVSWQLQAMFGYNPDFDPLPDSNFMIGFKFKLTNN